jgi:hypothetical protein
MLKILVPIIALSVSLAIQWFAHKGGRIVSTGEILGWSYDSFLINATIFTFKYFWIVIPVNIAFVYASKTGMSAYGSFLAFMLIWVAAAPIAAFIYNAVIAKDPVNILHVTGAILIFTGAILISANKEILNILK